jgi:hypothetical protein
LIFDQRITNRNLTVVIRRGENRRTCQRNIRGGQTE